MSTRSPGGPDTGPPSVDVEPARLVPSGPNRRFRRSTATGDNLRRSFGRQARSLVAVFHGLTWPVWNHIRWACARKEG